MWAGPISSVEYLKKKADLSWGRENSQQWQTAFGLKLQYQLFPGSPACRLTLEILAVLASTIPYHKCISLCVYFLYIYPIGCLSGKPWLMQLSPPHSSSKITTASFQAILSNKLSTKCQWNGSPLNWQYPLHLFHLLLLHENLQTRKPQVSPHFHFLPYFFLCSCSHWSKVLWLPWWRKQRNLEVTCLVIKICTVSIPSPSWGSLSSALPNLITPPKSSPNPVFDSIGTFTLISVRNVMGFHGVSGM